jgi:pantoate--beta-alanine ligase
MKIIQSSLELKENLNKLENIFLIPTMGNLHEGHISLIKEAKKLSDNIILTIFINPIQFNSKNDLESYPRTLSQDIDALKGTGVSILFNPSTEDIYPTNPNLLYKMPIISNELCGETRTDHFKGVITIIDRLFKLIKPSYAIFGKKDYQQLYLIKRFVFDSKLPIKIIEAPTIRNINNLALSSRNSLLNNKDINNAVGLYKKLKICAESVLNGVKIHDAELIAKKELAKEGWKIDYFEIRRQVDLKKPSYNDSKLVVLGAGFLGKVRLIDNIEFCIPTTI